MVKTTHKIIKSIRILEIIIVPVLFSTYNLKLYRFWGYRLNFLVFNMLEPFNNKVQACIALFIPMLLIYLLRYFKYFKIAVSKSALIFLAFSVCVIEIEMRNRNVQSIPISQVNYYWYSSVLTILTLIVLFFIEKYQSYNKNGEVGGED